MALISTPGQLRQQGEFYHQLSTLTKAGITIVQAVDLLRKNPPNRKLGRLAEHVMAGIVRGMTFTESIRTAQALPEFDTALLEAGEVSGRLAECLKMLGDFYNQKGQLASQMLSAMAYPVFMLHMAAFIFPLSLFTGLILQGQTGPFLINKLSILLPTYAATYFFIWSLQAARSQRWRATMEQLVHRIPFAGGTQRDLAMARLSAALEALINAGVTIIEAWDIAARASGSHCIERAVAEARPRLLQGELPSDAISAQSVYPDLFTTSYRTGEVSGQLDDALRRMYRYYMEAATTGLRRLAEWLPKIVYLIVAIAIGYQIVQASSDRFKMINDAIGQ